MTDIDWRTARRHKGTRWNSPSVKTFVPGVSAIIPPCRDQAVLDACALRVRLDEVQYLLTSGKMDLHDPSIRYGPEQAPQYDSRGVRLNTREKVLAERLGWERQGLVVAAQRIQPRFQPPSDFRMHHQQLQMKIIIPWKQYPDYNFIGLIIGPRGLTQKQMEKDTGCKIAIRGKGSVKDGKQKGASDLLDEPLHVLITAPTLEAMRKAEGLVRKLVTPVEESQNEHKRAQLRKLAEFNGTLMGYEESYAAAGGGGGGGEGAGPRGCRNCGAPGHPAYECGERGDRLGVPDGKTAREHLAEQYAAFCRAVGEQVPDPASQQGPDAEAAMDSFYQELEGKP